jgi:hypothetical protein
VTELDLMRTHCDALYLQNERSELQSTNEWQPRPPPAFWLGATRRGELWRFAAGLPEEVRAGIEALVRRAPAGQDGPLPANHAGYAAMLPGLDAVAGPTYWLPRVDFRTNHRVERVSRENATCLEGSALEAWLPDIPHQQPMFVSIDGGKAVAVCASVRIRPAAHEAGVETLPGHRHRGHAAAVVAAWAEELVSHGVLPLYSTTWDNAASQGIARRLGFEQFGWEYRLE